MFLIAAGIALQFAIYVVLLVLFSQYFVYFYWICVLVSLVMALFISTWKSKLAYKIAWIIPILLVPLIGGVMFIILGGARDSTTTGRRPGGPSSASCPPGCPPRT
ncbi:MAG: PLDc N-terminal domain-containing protein [Evtepia gabavorous]